MRLDDEGMLNLYRLNSITRYNNSCRLKNESVAAHSFYVAIFTLLLADMYKLSTKDKLDAITMALLHDLPEIEINDITHDTKVKLGLYKMLEEYEDEFYNKNFPEYRELMLSKGKSKKIMDLADILSVKQYALNELQLGNKSERIQQIIADTEVRINELIKELNNE